MANRRTGINLSSVTIFGTDYVSDVSSWEVTIDNKTAEGKAAQDTNDYPVAVGRGMTFTGELMMPASGAIGLIGTAASSVIAGSVSIVTGTATYVGSAMLTNVRHRIEREGIQTVSVELKSVGDMTVTVS